MYIQKKPFRAIPFENALQGDFCIEWFFYRGFLSFFHVLQGNLQENGGLHHVKQYMEGKLKNVLNTMGN
jgi:hypothetical protein